MTMTDAVVRVACLDDAERLVEIYAYYVRETAISFEYDVPSVEEFRGRMAQTLERYPYLVIERGGVACGYAYAGPFVGRAAYDWSVETTIYLDASARHQGLGTQLYHALEDVLAAMGVLNLNACIGYPREEDEHLTTASVDFHRHLGYELVGRFHRCGYKFGHWYDMVWMEKMIGAHPDEPEPVRRFDEVRDGLLPRTR
jgi:L-amino acid N-acyltransferase YncA